MGGVKGFTCAACKKKQNKGQPFVVTPVNCAAIVCLFSAAARGVSEALLPGALLCTERREYRGANGKLPPVTLEPCVPVTDQAALNDLMVGKPVSMVFPDETTGRPVVCDGTIMRILMGRGRSGRNGSRRAGRARASAHRA